LYQNGGEYAHLGNIGTATHSLIWKQSAEKGFQIGLSQYNPYFLKAENLRYYDNPKPFTSLYYTQLGTKNIILEAVLAHRFSKRLLYTLDYTVINQLGFYNHQRTRNMNVRLATLYRYKKYSGEFLFHNAQLFNQENGGIASIQETEGLNNLSLRGIDVWLSTPETNLNKTTIRYRQTFGKKDSVQMRLSWFHQIQYDYLAYRFYDKTPNEDYYGSLLLNPRGLRNNTYQWSIENRGGLSFLYKGWSIKAWIDYTLLKGKQENNKYLIHQSFINFHSSYSGKFFYEIAGDIGILGYNLGDYHLSGKLGYDLGKMGKIYIHAQQQANAPIWLAQKMYIVEENLWENDFKKTIETNIGANYEWEKQNLSIEANIHNVYQLLLFNESLSPEQINKNIQILSTSVRKGFFWKAWGMDNKIVWQQTSDKENIRVPNFIFKHSLFFQKYIFKKAMQAKIGATVRYQTKYLPLGYSPLLGQFYTQNTENIPFLPIVDLFFMAKVKTFRFFIMGENISHFYYKRPNFLVALYPTNGFQLRFGVRWHLWD
jgi:hypothetical protein